MTIKNSPEHPVAAAQHLFLSSGSIRHLDNFLGVIVLNWVIAPQLDQVVARNALAAIDPKRLLLPAQLCRSLLRRQHLHYPTAVFGGSLVEGSLAHDGSLCQLVGSDNQDGARRHGIGRSLRGREGSRDSLAPGQNVGAVVVPGAVSQDQTGGQRNGQTTDVHGRPQRLIGGAVVVLAGVACEEVEVAAAGGPHWVSDAGVVTCPERPDSSTMHLDDGGARLWELACVLGLRFSVSSASDGAGRPRDNLVVLV